MKPCFAASLLITAACVPAHALDIQLNPSAGMNANALAGFQMAATYWESVLTDSVQVNIDIGFQTLAPNVLGQANSQQTVVSAFSYFTALAGDASSSYDTLAVGNLPSLASGGLNFLTQTNTEGGSTLVSLDSDNSGNNLFLALNQANAKALELYSGTTADASITFSDTFSWDFDPTDANGVGAGLQDFVGVAIHEIGHALGFTSGVDTVGFGIDQSMDLDIYAIYSGLDMFRYSAAGVLDLAIGGTPYFSLDGGATNLAPFSTGITYGDGHQASHWKDNLGIGIMDPTALPPGQVNEVSTLDLIALDVVGWNVQYSVPEPTAPALTALAILGLALRRRRR
jgi:hypothetical protein